MSHGFYKYPVFGYLLSASIYSCAGFENAFKGLENLTIGTNAMTDFSYLERNQNRAFQEVERFLERAVYFYSEKEDVSQALVNYMSALSAYTVYVGDMGTYLSVVQKTPINIEHLPRQTGLVFAKVLFDLFALLNGIINCYSDSAEKAFLVSQTQVIVEGLDKYQYVFDTKQLREYDSLRFQDRSRKAFIEKYSDLIEDLKKTYKSDELFKEIVEALNKISAAEVCPVSLGISSCFIATAAYSNDRHPDLDTFRVFRDRKLLSNWFGRFLVRIYYQIGPYAADRVKRHPAIQDFVRQQLMRLAGWMRRRSIVN